MKKALIIIAVCIALGIAWYLVSPLWRTVTLDEASPLEQMQGDAVAPLATGQDATMPDTPQQDPPANAPANEAQPKNLPSMSDEKPAAAMGTEPLAPSAPAQQPSSAPAVVAQGVFQASAHEVQGRALLIESNGKKTVRFEDFETINGPNLHIYLGADLEGKDFIDLGEIRATKGNVNYELPPDVDLGVYNKVMVWCVPFRVLFSYAELR